MGDMRHAADLGGHDAQTDLVAFAQEDIKHVYTVPELPWIREHSRSKEQVLTEGTWWLGLVEDLLAGSSPAEVKQKAQATAPDHLRT